MSWHKLACYYFIAFLSFPRLVVELCTLDPKFPLFMPSAFQCPQGLAYPAFTLACCLTCPMEPWSSSPLSPLFL